MTITEMLLDPSGIALDNNYIYVSDIDNVIKIFLLNGEYIGRIGESDGLSNPQDLYISNGYLYVEDTGNSRTMIYFVGNNFNQEKIGYLNSTLSISNDINGDEITPLTVEVDIEQAEYTETFLPLEVEVKEGLTNIVIDARINPDIDTYYRKKIQKPTGRIT